MSRQQGPKNLHTVLSTGQTYLLVGRQAVLPWFMALIGRYRGHSHYCIEHIQAQFNTPIRCLDLSISINACFRIDSSSAIFTLISRQAIDEKSVI